MAAAIRRFERALATDGVDSRSLGANLRLLESSFSSHNFTFHQYQNVFQFFMGAVTQLSRTSILSHDQVLHTVLKHDPRQCVARCMSIDAVAEMVLREVLVSALGMQSLDRYMSTVLREISMLTEKLSNHSLTRMMNYDPERLVSRIHKAEPEHRRPDDAGLQRAGAQADGGLQAPVPQGFILTTELFSAMPAMAHRPLYTDTVERVRRAIGDLEKETGLRLGDPGRLLTLSIRSGAAISMPGLMTTFVDVGLNDTLAEALSRKPGFEWAAWDSYRRFLQTWAMASGIDRDVFDAIMVDFKARYGVERKSDFLPEHMREMAFAYKARGRELGVRYTDDPFRQVMACIRKVLGSWDSSEAKLYRQYLGVAEEWGTAVVVQRMVFGNRSREVGIGRHLHPQPPGAPQQPGAAVRGLHGAKPGRGPCGGSRVPLARLRGPAAGQPHLQRAGALAREETIPRSTRHCSTWPRPGRPARARPSGDRVHLRVGCRPTTSTSCRSGPWCRSRPRTPRISTPRRGASGPPWPSAWAWPAELTPAG